MTDTKLLDRRKILTYKEFNKIGETLANHFQNINPTKWGICFDKLYENTYFRKAMYKFLSNFPKDKLLEYIDFSKVDVNYRLAYIEKLKEEYGKVYAD